MGSIFSKRDSPRHSSSYGSGSFSWSQENYPQPPSPHTHPSYDYGQPHFASPQSYGGVRAPASGRKLERKYSKIEDNYNSLEQVTDALARAGLESSNLIVGIDFTKSNEWTGARSFHRKSLHHIGEAQNPYEQAISIIGKTLSSFDEDNLIPCFGFGDASTHDQEVFSFHPDERFCNGFEEVLSRYRELVPQLKLAGPTSFAPIIEMAITIVEQSNGQYHVLVIIADGQVTRSIDTERGQLSPQEKKTVEAIVKASDYPLSIIVVGVGDGPWDMMKEFDDNIPARAFDNFQARFVFHLLTMVQLQSAPQSMHDRATSAKCPFCGAAVGRATPASSASDNHVRALFLYLQVTLFVRVSKKLLSSISSSRHHHHHHHHPHHTKLNLCDVDFDIVDLLMK
ncbi:hypothetical protein FNV43_RR21429 [Rhamnella rubrinervis]|uniref:VWFA domain-containing protein n=1 Tax=Rhamnella rubrinervis TaxID=2594499 RepID=A0A8K0DWM3_9ROSA|nr:hypothetical protein FNV43_RR21429 [Rhamnella rubrinervis]